MNKAEEKIFFPGISKHLPLIILAIVILFSVGCRLRLLDVPLERDEGEYAYVAQQLLHGIPPFISIYHVKLPGIYAAYAVMIALFGETNTGIHLGLLFVNVFTAIVVYFTGKRIFNTTTGAWAAICFVLFTLSRKTQGFSANAEHFVLLFAMPGILMMLRGIDLPFSGYRNKAMVYFFLSGLLLGVSYTMKQHGAFFIAFSGLFFVYKWLSNNQPNRWKNLWLSSFCFVTGLVLPIIVICLEFIHLKLFDKFWWWTWYYPRIYAVQKPLATGIQSLHPPAADTGQYETWAIFWPMLMFGIWGLVSIIIESGWDRKIFVLGLTILSVLAVCVGFNFFPHYFILAAPAVGLLVAAGAASSGRLFKNNFPFLRTGFVSMLIVFSAMIITERNYLFAMDGGTVSHITYEYAAFPETVDIGKYIEKNSLPSDRIAVLGSEPQIYFYAKRRAATGFVYTYEMMRDHQYVHEFQTTMVNEIEAANPKFIVDINMPGSWYSTPLAHIDSFLFNRSQQYIKRYYKQVGIVNIVRPGHDNGIFCWDTVGIRCQPGKSDWIGIYRREE